MGDIATPRGILDAHFYGPRIEEARRLYPVLMHYFFADTGLPESRQVFDVIADFFDRKLAR